MSNLKVAVVGAGVIGITTAVELQKQFRNANITIIADKFNTSTTSYVAAGLFRPGTSFSGVNEDITRVHPHIVRNHYIEKIVPIYRAATEEELKLCPGNWKYGSFFTTFLTQCSLYLPWAAEKFVSAGGNIVEQQIKSLSSVGLEYDVTVNCTGLGAKYLCNDHKLVPIRGQVVKHDITLGGCRQYDSYDLNINKYDGLSIRERCEALVPSLQNAKTVAQRVVLRPHRDTVRVEKEVQKANGKRIKIVHNYGHGGYGVTTAPGTALHACQLVKEILMGNSKL
ncbi:hypothetical protein NQ314_010235 [Rhamnusium bicolor]|uniref:FAD dependent oxidoreductase domain-containing protein n=1 Tax=Rhamnusium bicolor TaxID=1586634 RepID=A0AAV8XUS4_9CUCU|nr:hypothetical protein NQ314_010235 [Rhamnusium bicolor]